MSVWSGTGSVEGGTGWYLVVLGQYGAELVNTYWYLVRKKRYLVVLGKYKASVPVYIEEKKWRFGWMLP